MSIYIVIDKKQNKNIIKENKSLYTIITAKEYITNSSFLDEKKAYIINLCSSYKYQSIGYYVSLLAEARNHKPIPEVLQIQDLKSLKVLRKITNQCSELIEKSFTSITSDHFELSVYFGKNIALRHEKLSKELFQLLKIPLFKVFFIREKSNKNKNSNWKIKAIQQLKLEDIPLEHNDFFNIALEDYINLKKKYQKKIKQTHYDLAILINPEEKAPPSNEKALSKFQNIGKKMGFNVEILYPDDLNRLAEFDALFIRETTSVNHHTYQFSRLAEAMGLIVIDDPNSILKCSNKVFLTELLIKHKIKIPQTYILYKANFLKIAEKLEYPCVLKQPDSAFSIGVIKVDNKEEFIKEAENLFKTSELLLVQKFIYTDFDWRIGILDKKPLYACKYFMAKNHWQIYNWQAQSKNIEEKEGGFETLPLYKVPDKVIDIALRSANLIGSGLYGVDIKEINGEPYVMEVNDNPNIDAGIEDAYYGNKLYETILKYFYDKIQKLKNQ
ncbi:MAG: ribosomal protein S6 modification protein [Leptospiraceae bacterium]|nr:MAG: ribosomal protein S6 modification protein [Leptospiraceae bacterium]